MLICPACGRAGCPNAIGEPFPPPERQDEVRQLKEKCRQQQLEINSFAGRRSRQQEEIARLHQELEARRAIDAWCAIEDEYERSIKIRGGHIQAWFRDFELMIERSPSYVELAKSLKYKQRCLECLESPRLPDVDSCGDCPGCGIQSNDECPPEKP